MRRAPPAGAGPKDLRHQRTKPSPHVKLPLAVARYDHGNRPRGLFESLRIFLVYGIYLVGRYAKVSDLHPIYISRPWFGSGAPALLFPTFTCRVG